MIKFFIYKQRKARKLYESNHITKNNANCEQEIHGSTIIFYWIYFERTHPHIIQIYRLRTMNLYL